MCRFLVVLAGGGVVVVLRMTFRHLKQTEAGIKSIPIHF